MFKKIVKSIAAIKTENDRDECYWQIDRAFEEERISYERIQDNLFDEEDIGLKEKNRNKLP